MSIYKGTDLVAGMPSYGDIIDTLYPVGSVYIGTTSTCPLAAIKGTWTLKSSGIVTSVNTNVPCKGTGKALGLTNGSVSYPLANYAGGNWALGLDNTTDYSLSTATPSFATVNGRFGVNTDSSKSGIVGTVTRSVYTVNIWERTA